MNLFQVSVAASTLLFASQSYAIDCYNLDQKSVAYQTCMLRKENDDRDYRLRKEREEREKKEASDRYNEKWAREAKEKEREAKEEKREAKEKSDKYWENERIRKEQKEQQQKTPMTAEDMKGMAEALAGLSEIAAMASQPYVKRVGELSNARQCKEAHALIKSESRGGDKMMLNTAEIYHGFVAESCDKDRKKAVAHYSRAARNGSMMAKMKLDELKKAGAENEKAVTEVTLDAEVEHVVSEAEAMQLVKKNNCFACHAIDKKVVGPAWKDVAAKYRGDTEAEARLSDKIAKGGSGVWGVMAMPPSPQVSEADRMILVRFVLSLK